MHQPRIITLLTDFGNQDAYTGIMKGVIAGINPSANIIDICHSIPPQDIFSGAYLLFTAYKYFPKGTIHIAVVDPGVGSQRDILCVEIRDDIYLVPDNGILSFILREERPKRIIRVTNNRYFLKSLSNTFHGRDVFAPVAAHLSLGIKPQQLGDTIPHLKTLDIPQPVFENKEQWEGRVISIDRFGNLITNITRAHIDHHIIKQKQNRNKGAGVRSQKSEAGSRIPRTSRNKMLLPYSAMETTLGGKKIRGLDSAYTDVKPGKPLILIGSAGFLEVSVNKGDARQYFKVDRGDIITIRNCRKHG